MGKGHEMYFTVRDSFGDNVGAAEYSTFDDAAEAFEGYCNSHGADADGAWMGVVYKGEDRDYKCALAQHRMTSMGNRYFSMEDNISEQALAIPEIQLAALRASQLQYPFDERTQRRIDELEKRLGVFERDVKTAGDLRIGKWRVHIVPTGGRYGYENRLVNKDRESLIEFWDMSAKKSAFPDGQFVTRYAVDSLYDTKWGHGADALMRGGLCLDGDNADVWSLSGSEMVQVFNWLKNRELLPGEIYLRFSGEADVPFDVVDRVPLTFMDSRALASEAVLIQCLDGLAHVRELHVERAGEYKNGTGYTFSFSTLAAEAEVVKDLERVLKDLPHEFCCEQEHVPTEKKELNEVIKSCEDVSKNDMGADGRETGREEPDDRDR